MFFTKISFFPLADSGKQTWQSPVDRPSRPTWTAVHVCTSADRPVDRDQCQCSLFVSVDRIGRPSESSTLRQSCGRPSRSTDLPNGRIYDRWRSTGPVDR